MENNINNKPIAIVLAGTTPHIALIENLKERGYYTILVDYYENPPAKKAADRHIQESTLDQEKVLDIAKKVGAPLVITTCMDHANVTACYVAEKLGLPAPYSYETALSVTNKGLMKEKMVRHGIPTSKYTFVKNISGFESADLRFPVAVKPADSNGSKGVRKASGYKDLSKFLEDALEISRSNQAIIEEYNEGREIGADCFINKDQEAAVLMTRERRKIVADGDTIQQIQGSFWPADLTERNTTDLKRIVEQIAHAFSLKNTPLIMQAVVKGDEIHVIEFGARIGGGENYRIIELHTGFDIINAAVDSFLGLPVTMDYKLPTCLYADIYLYTRPGVFGNITGYEDLLKNRIVEYLNVYKAKGVTIGSELSGNNRIGAFLVKAQDERGLLDNINSAINSIEAYDIHGEPMMRKDIYSKELG